MALKLDDPEALATNVWYSDDDARKIRAQEVESLESLKQEHEESRATIARQKKEIELRAQEVESLESLKQEHEESRVAIAKQKKEIGRLEDELTALTEIRSIECGSLDRHTQQNLEIRNPRWSQVLHSLACILAREASLEAWCAIFSALSEVDSQGVEVQMFPRASGITDREYFKQCVEAMQSPFGRVHHLEDAA